MEIPSSILSNGGNINKAFCPTMTMAQATFNHALPISIYHINNCSDIQLGREPNEVGQTIEALSPAAYGSAAAAYGSAAAAYGSAAAADGSAAAAHGSAATADGSAAAGGLAAKFDAALEEQDLSNTKRGRTAFSICQYKVLENMFNKSRYLNRQDRQDTARRLSLTERQVKIWFQNRRQKHKKQTQNRAEEKFIIESARQNLRRNMHKKLVQRLLTYSQEKRTAPDNTNTTTNASTSNSNSKQTEPDPWQASLPLQQQPIALSQQIVPYHYPEQHLYPPESYPTGNMWPNPQQIPPMSYPHAMQILQPLSVVSAQPSFNGNSNLSSSHNNTSTSTERSEVQEVWSECTPILPPNVPLPLPKANNNNNEDLQNIKRGLESAAYDWSTAQPYINVPQNLHTSNYMTNPDGTISTPNQTTFSSPWGRYTS